MISRPPTVLDYRFQNLVDGLSVDVNFTEIVSDPTKTRLTMRMSTTSNTRLASDFCRFGLKLLAVNQETCDGVSSGAGLDIQEIASINKAGNFFSYLNVFYLAISVLNLGLLIVLF